LRPETIESMTTKNIEVILAPGAIHWVGDGFRVHNFIPGNPRLTMRRMDPFILMDYNLKHTFPPSEKPRGVGVHPHRGFETVSIAYKGRIAHHDSSGAGGVIGEGEVQWMTAASGVLHKEYHELEFSRKGGEFHMVQLWVNLPAKDKMSPPKYQAVTRESMQKYLLPGNLGTIEVIAGEHRGIKGSASTFTPMHLLNARLKPGVKESFSFPAHYNTALLVIEGNVRINDTERAKPDHFVLFENTGETFTLATEEDAIALILSGEPIGEPIAAGGPFVMNTREELAKAYEDYHSGKFGFLED